MIYVWLQQHVCVLIMVQSERQMRLRLDEVLDMPLMLLIVRCVLVCV